MKSFEKLRAKLAELFQLDQADLDFGIYCIVNARRGEITRFLEHDRRLAAAPDVKPFQQSP